MDAGFDAEGAAEPDSPPDPHELLREEIVALEQLLEGRLLTGHDPQMLFEVDLLDERACAARIHALRRATGGAPVEPPPDAGIADDAATGLDGSMDAAMDASLALDAGADPAPPEGGTDGGGDAGALPLVGELARWRLRLARRRETEAQGGRGVCSQVQLSDFVAVRLRAKVYVLDVHYETEIQTDVTERVLEAFLKARISSPAVLHRAVARTKS